MNALPPGHRAEPGHQARWLWRTLHAAEQAGLDPARVLADAIAERDLAGARDIPAVIDARLRHRLDSLAPLPSRPWSSQVPAIADPERRAYLTEIAALMDARKDRLGEHAAEHAPPWAVTALGPVPAHPVDRLDWQRRASSISAYPHPGAAKVLGRQARGFSEQCWAERRFELVVTGNLAKFGQHPDLREFLLGTGDRVLVEASPRDQVWGIGLAADDERALSPERWPGLNLLGFALMEVRHRLRAPDPT